MESWGLVVFAGVLLVGAWYISRLMSEHQNRSDRNLSGDKSRG